MSDSETQLEKNKRLMKLAGYESEDETNKSDILHDSEQLLMQYKARKAADQDKSREFDDLQLQWNSDHTLNMLIAYQNGGVLYRLNFVWNADGSLSQIIRG